jgi:hypothetical protein
VVNKNQTLQMSVSEKSCESESTSEKELTTYDVLRRTWLVQTMKLLFLHDVVIKGNDICIKHIVNEKKLIEILDEYRDHYDDVMKYRDTITIYNLEEDSLLRSGLQKEVLNFMTPYMDWKSGEFGKIVCKSEKDNKFKEYIYNGGWEAVDTVENP